MFSKVKTVFAKSFFVVLALITFFGCQNPSASNNSTPVDPNAPTGVTVELATAKNTVKVKWTDNNSAYYWIYYNSSNDTETATCATKSAYSYNATHGYEITLPSTGTYYFWVKSADGYSSTSTTSGFSVPAIFNFTYTSLSAPTGLSVESTTTKNTIKVTWTDNGSAYYWIYYNSTNDTSTATCATKSAYSYNATHGYEITLPSTGTYYFWVKSADGYTKNDTTSDFSSPATFDFTYTELVTPSGLKIENSSTKNTVKITWTDNGSNYYWIYYNTEDDSSTATCATKSADYYNATHGYELTLPSTGTYYFWIKASDGYTSKDATSDFSNYVSFDFTHIELTAPTNITVEATSTSKTVSIKWTDNGFAYYWIYYNSSNDTETATCATKSAYYYNATHGYELTLPSTGTYYFWIKASDGYVSKAATSDFSEPAIFTLSN